MNRRRTPARALPQNTTICGFCEEQEIRAEKAEAEREGLRNRLSRVLQWIEVERSMNHDQEPVQAALEVVRDVAEGNYPTRYPRAHPNTAVFAHRAALRGRVMQAIRRVKTTRFLEPVEPVPASVRSAIVDQVVTEVLDWAQGVER